MNKPKSGFTLLELLVVVGILAALVALALPFYQDYVNQSKLTAAAADLQTFKKALAMYDQLEASMFNGANFLPLIGKYLQDYRSTAGQLNPIDPWSNDYRFNNAAGSIWSYGPNGADDSTLAGVVQRAAGGDDILVTWKPDFFLASAKKINDTTLEISFSRKVGTVPAFIAANVTASGGGAGVNLQKISDSIFRVRFGAVLSAAGLGTVTVLNTVAAQDGRQLVDADKPDNPVAETVTY